MDNKNSVVQEQAQTSTSTSCIVKLRGRPLDYVLSLKASYLNRTGKTLAKGDAIQLILNRVPKKVIEEAIKEIVNEAQPRK